MSFIIYLAIALSIDAFCVALSIGFLTNSSKKHMCFAAFVGLFHFFMPLLGAITNKIALKSIIVNGNKLMGVILIILVIQMILEIKNNKENIKLNIPILAFSVSVDSYFAGIGLSSLNENNINFLLFSTISIIFSYTGCKLGVLGKTKLKNIAKWISVIILLVLGVKYLLL